MMEWKKVDENMPKEDERCLVIRNGRIDVLTWSEHYQNWDDMEGDDYFCNKNDVSFYIPFSYLPPFPKEG